MLQKSFSEPWDVFQPSGNQQDIGGGGSELATIAGFMMITMTNKGE